MGKVETALKHLSDEKPLDKIQTLVLRADDIEKMPFKITNVTLQAFEEQNADIQEARLKNQAAASTLEERVSPSIQEQPLMNTGMEALRNEISKTESHPNHIEERAVTNDHLSQRLSIAGQQSKAMLDKHVQGVQQNMSAQLASVPLQQQAGPSGGSKDPLASNNTFHDLEKLTGNE